MAPISLNTTTPQRSLVELVQVRQADESLQEGRYKVVIAANERSRNPGMDLNLAGVVFDNYRKNPVVLWAHDDGTSGPLGAATPSGGIPIGQTLSVGHDPQGRIVAEFEFNSADPFAARVENAWKGGFLRAASIRWLPLRVVEVPDPETGETRLRSEESDLLEWSIVPVPADPDTVKQAARSLNLPEEIFRVAPSAEKHHFLDAYLGGWSQQLVKNPGDYESLCDPIQRAALAAAAARLSESIKERRNA